VVRLLVTGGSLTGRPKRSLRCLLEEVSWQIKENLTSEGLLFVFTLFIFKTL